ncbi:hypothetical protein Q5H93_12325 [Hymenobacter sp. ASUV-10]|uniref:Uncharacterized protein n=1 Tax=Hymenobacter aranciens TaxID=3063996 RepID=A0ABT9BB65_9BACT|nr:hypothetical protein [Hymenobacter sp. ASUV-10]MDO7875521.1 hypothetical protein [Hymenobacter sp. ASUV-10]
MHKSEAPALVATGCITGWLALLTLKLAGFAPVATWSWWWVWAPLWWWPAWLLLRTAGRWLGYFIRTRLLRR